MDDWPFAPLERGKYAAILADPPWRFEAYSDKGKDRSPDKHYDTMRPEEIAALPVGDLAAKDCVLFLWVSFPFLQQALKLIQSWGFSYKTAAFTWLKADPYRLWVLEEDVYMGLGYWTRANSEVCLLATRGKPKRLHADVRQGIIAPRRQHSRKPDCIHERIERLVAGPYCELFARESARPGWDYWGVEKNLFNINQLGK